ncbi:hypothetical protein ABIA30_000865 [Mycobacterium sp. MAA66]|uniref:hypothetical protein n=1 Tax=Mycobacterium sp. MAA66 TaxID=3156297 RepID=UPI0035197468
MLLTASVISAAVVGIIGYQSGRASLRNAAFDRLTQVRASQALQLAVQVADLKNAFLVYTSGPATADALQAFSAAFNQLSNATVDSCPANSAGSSTNAAPRSKPPWTLSTNR